MTKRVTLSKRTKRMETLKQPELGQTILQLRTAKQLTQEELVEQCNINVRTLQRIEAGEVTPRDFTIKTILDVLDYKVEEIEKSIQNKESTKHLQLGWIAGVVYFVFGIFEVMVDFGRFEPNLPSYFPFIYVSVKAIATLSFVYFMLGFVAVGNHFQNSLLKISAFLMFGAMVVMELYDIISIMGDLTDEEFIGIKGIQAVAFGGIDIIFGIALLRLAKHVGTSAQVAGVFEIIAGACFVTFILAFLGLFMLIPANLLEIIVLYKVYDMLKTKV